ncbi:hypothetical protein ACJ5NV_18305 [Loktanella agnita]|uniref:hypothetical protein n=1 Tax=Loktanella agnita TaxID=287097 RepID=UPI00398A11CB
MTINFALVLSFEGIELLHRVQHGWKPVGRKADVEDPKLDTVLADLQAKALSLTPDGLRSKIVIPMDQIKYLAIDSTRTDMDDIYAALDGATPYALKDLVIDYEKSGGRTHVAAVARETLFEAEAFARAHKFNPVSFVAIPEPFTFQKEVFFGPTNMMQQVLGPDGHVARDALPVMKVGTRVKSRMLIFDASGDTLPETDEDDLAALFGENVAPEPSIPAEALPPVPDIDLAALLAPHVDPSAPDAEPEVEAAAQTDVTDTPAALWVDEVVAEYQSEPDVPSSAPAPVVSEPAASEPVVASPKVPAPVAPILFDRVIPETIPPAPVKAPPKPVAAPVVEKTPEPVTAPVVAQIPAPMAPVLLDPVIAEYHTGQPKQKVLAPIALTARPPQPPAAMPQLNATHLSRPSALNIPEAPSRNEPLYIGGALAACLALAGVFAWTQMSSGDAPVAVVEEPAAPVVTPEVVTVARTQPVSDVSPDVPALDPQPLPQPVFELGATPVLGNITPVMAAAAPPALGVETPDVLPTQIADIETDAGDIIAFDTPQPSLGAPVLRGRVLSPDEADQVYNATGVWQRAARHAALPPSTTLDDLIRPITLAAPRSIAQPELPALDDLQADQSFLSPSDPPPAEVSFPIDENGFILATPEGTPTPDGAIVTAGLPDLNVRLRPELSEDDLARMELLAPAPDGVVIIAGRPAVTPPLRPADARLPEAEDATAENAETTIADATDVQPEAADAETDVAALRPEPRSDDAIAAPTSNPDITSIIADIAAEEDTLQIDPDEGTVAASRRPETRPQNFARVVTAARERAAAQQQQAAAAPVQTAAPVAPQNYAPVPGGVARAATQDDVIGLRDMNLIGVYGRPNARRALVRLSNGRYVRVEVGSALDGGQVTAIGEAALNYVKRGRTIALELPSG